MRGQLLGARYRIQDRIGEGGMAFVYLALDERLGRTVAIKVLHEHMERNPDIRKRFQAEAQAISGLDHPNIVKIYDWSGGGNERLWIVTEAIKGKNLAELMQTRTGGWLHPALAACVVREICKALHKAHTTGIVHRDIKPENVMITNDGLVKLMDFGIAKDLQKSSMTLTGTFMGSPSYMSPEQIRGKDVDHRTDLYSLSILFYEVVTGRLPFVGQTTHDVVMKIVDGEFTYPRFLMPNLPLALDSIIIKGMSKDIAKRFSTADEYGFAIDQFLTSNGLVESHIELERYFADRKGWEQRLAARPLAGTAPRTEVLVRQSVHAATTRERKDTRAEATHSGHQAPTSSPNSVSGPVAAQMATQLVPGRNRDDRRLKPRTLPPDRIAHVTRRTRHDMPPAQAPQAVSQRSLPNPPAYRIVASTQIEPARPMQAQASGESSSAVQQPTPRMREHRVRPPVPRRSRMRPLGQRRPVQNHDSSTLARFSGILMVGFIISVVIWGFIELHRRIGENPRATPRASETTKATRPATQATRPVATVPTPPSTTLPAASATTQPTRVEIVTPSTRPESPRRTVVDASETPTRRTTVTTVPSTDARLSPSTTRRVAPNPAQTSSRTTPSTRAVRVAPVSQPSPPETQRSVAETASISVSAQPAAEIFVDGRRVGTTVDRTSGSGWITIPATAKRLELRRAGWETWREDLSLSPGEKQRIGPISLTRNEVSTPRTEAEARSYTLTIRARPVPVEVRIRNVDTEAVQTFTMKESTRALNLAAGRWQIRIERGGDVRERLLNLSGDQTSFTFNAEFRDSEGQQTGTPADAKSEKKSADGEESP